MVAKVMTYGATLTELYVPDKNGKAANVVLGFDNLKQYLGPEPFFGATVGRYANRIAGARFTLNGHEYTLAANNGDNSLHGGNKGFDKKIWSAKPVQTAKGQAVVFSYHSADMEEGYPGNLDVSVTYLLTDDALEISYDATTDKPTVLNLTNHSYFNLGPSGESSGPIDDELLMAAASRYTPTKKDLIPTGEIRSVAGTPFDFRRATAIGARYEQLRETDGYDCNLVLDRPAIDQLAARLTDPKSGRIMEVYTDQPGVQIYTANGLDGSVIGSGQTPYRKHAAVTFETQHFPDSPNHSNFPSTTLNSGQHFTSRTIYRFKTESK